MAGVTIGQPPVGVERAVEERDEPGLDGAPEHRAVDAGDRLSRTLGAKGLRGEHPLQHRAQQRGGRSLAGDVADGEPEPAIRQLDVVEKVSSNGAAWQRLGRRVEVAAMPGRRGQERLLDLGRGLHLLLHPGLLEGFAVELGVLDGDRRMGGQALERRPCLVR